jgi:transcriptional regulator with XRE-family HTH domain
MRRSLAARLRQVRRDAGLTTTELARATGISQGKISKIETGTQSARVDHVDAWVRACGMDATARHQLLELAHTALTEASVWRQEHGAGLAAKQRRVERWEQRAARIRDFQSALVPGLLQTRGYATTVLGMANVSGQGDLDKAVSARLARQRILEQPDPSIELIVTEAALAWSFRGGDQLWSEQRQRLVDTVIAERVRLGVLLSEAPAPPRLNAFTIYDFADTGEQLVVVETFAAELYHDDHRDVALYGDIFDALSAAARFGEAAAELVRTSG